jgi:hypothetical protein
MYSSSREEGSWPEKALINDDCSESPVFIVFRFFDELKIKVAY